ncbi:transposable element gene, partial [Prunus dulcis]
PALSLSRENGPPPSKECWRHLRAPPATGPVALEPSSSPLPSPTNPTTDDLCWPETAKERRELTETHRNFKASDLPPPATISVDPGGRFWVGQNTGETLPNFRQESKESFNSNCSRKGKMVVCARQLPGVGHAQDLVRIPKWNWDRVLSRYATFFKDIFPYKTIISKEVQTSEKPSSSSTIGSLEPQELRRSKKARVEKNFGDVIHQMDVKTAFLNGDLDEEIYKEQPEGFIVKAKSTKCQAPKQWHEKFDK